MDKEKAQAYEIIGNIICKMFLVFVISVGWAVLVGFLIYNPSIPLGISVAGGPLGMMVMLGRHFFPKKGS
jgi:hypothetical protein